MLVGQASIQRAGQAGDRVDGNIKRFSKGKCKVLWVGCDNPSQHHKPGLAQPEPGLQAHIV